MHDVFISHASVDADSARRLVASLEQRGVRCWVAPRDVAPGSDYAEAIVDAIRGSRMTIVLISDAAIRSAHVRREVERAAHVGIPTLPVRVEDVSPSGSLEYFLSGAHYIDWLSGSADAPATSIHRTLERASDEPEATSAGPTVGTPSPARNWNWIAGGAALIGLLGLVLALNGDDTTAADTTLVAAPTSTAPLPVESTPATVAAPVTSASPTTPPAATTGPTTTAAPTTTVTSSPPAAVPADLLAEAATWPIRLAEPFDDNSRDWFEGTQSDDNGEQTFQLSEGEYLIELNGNANSGSYYSTKDLVVGSRLMAEVRVTALEYEDAGACGLAARMVSGRDLFAAVSRDTSRGGAALFVDREISVLVGDEASLSETGSDVVTLILDGPNGYVLANGEVVGSFEDDRLEDVIAVGLGAQFGDVLRCRFDDLVVRAP